MPAEPAGLVAVQVVELLQETFVAAFAPNVIVVAPGIVLKLVPEIVTPVPPSVKPELGVTPATDGVGVI